MSASAVLPQVWRASELASADGATVPTGHALLDAELPAAGWPLGTLIELLANDAKMPWSVLLLPALAAHLRQQKGTLVLLDPPFLPYAPALAAAGVPTERMLWLRSQSTADALWLAGQASACIEVQAVLAWLPHARSAHLRRLHAVARRRSTLLLFTFLDAAGPAALAPSCAPLRLAVQWAAQPLQEGVTGPRLRVDILRRRGPPLLQPLWLPACHAALQALLTFDEQTACVLMPVPGAKVLAFPQQKRATRATGHALDRLAVAG